MRDRRSPARKPLATLLADYGPFRIAHSGSGVLHIGRPVRCSFRLAQAENGSCFLACRLGELEQFITGRPAEVMLSLSGKSAGLDIDVPRDKAMAVSEHHVYAGERDSMTEVVFRIRQFSTSRRVDGVSCQQRFLLTNLELDESDSCTLCVEWRGRSERVTLARIEDYRAVVRRVELARSTAVTAHMTFASEVEDAVGLADALCRVLSLGEGRKVQWIAVQVLDEDEAVLDEDAFSQATRHWGPWPPIQTERDALTSYVESVFDTYVERRECWGLDRLIDAYCDAKGNLAYLESSAIQLVVVLEMLKAQYLQVHGPKDGRILSKAQFRRLTKALKDAVGAVGLDYELSDEDRCSMTEKVQEFNRYSFRSILRRMCLELDVGLSEPEQTRLTKLRNGLVHSGRFPSEAGDNQPTHVESFMFLHSAIDRLFLSVLKYKGYYWDWGNRSKQLLD
jgi:hypothetical protein